jgi:hypothetical protein
MKTGTFRRWLKEHYPNQAFRKDGRISKLFVRKHQHEWNLTIRRKATFFLNSVKG